MNDDFEDYLQAARPAEPPPELMRRLRQAEPALGRMAAARRWPWAQLIAAVATVTLLGILASPHRLFTEDSAAPKRRDTSARTNRLADDDFRSFGGSVAMSIQLGATPNLIPVSLRPNYDPRAPRSPAGLSVANPISESISRF